MLENTHETQAFGSGVVGAVPRDLPAGMPLGDWRIDARIGEGGMGIVYSALHDVIGKRAAIKVIRSEVCRNPGACDRFLQEARIVNQIGHRNIVDIFHIGQLDDGRPYLVMELLVGQTLGDRLDVGRIPALEAIDILLQICAALEAAHAAGVIHRDLKPDNVILARIHDVQVVKLLDWGIAKIRDPDPQADNVRGTLIGTPRYIAPEQARGRPVDGCTDIYSLGAIAYEMFLESPPFTCDNVADLLAAHLAEEVPPPRDVWPDIPDELETLLLGMLAKEPEQRPSIAQVAIALHATKLELRRRAGHVDGESEGQAPAAVANLAVAVGEWSDEPPRRAEAQALLDTHQLDVVPSNRRGTAVGVIAAAVTLLLVAVFGYLVSGRRPLRDTAAGKTIAVASERAAASVRARPPSMLEMRVRPPNARVEVDHVVVETSAGRALRTVPQGDHEVEVTAAGYHPYRRQVDVGAGALILAIDLEPIADDASRSRAKSPRPAPRRRPRIDPDGTIDPFR